jgi:hypothetical protein
MPPEDSNVPEDWYPSSVQTGMAEEDVRRSLAEARPFVDRLKAGIT